MNPGPLEIVQVSTSDTGGGAERIAADLHRACLARGFRSTLAVGFSFDGIPNTVVIPNDASRSAWARAVLKLQPPLPQPPAKVSRMGCYARRAVKIVAEPQRAWRRAQGYEGFAYPGTGAIPNISGRAADIIHLHNLHGGYFDLRQLPALSAAAPTLLTAHDTWLATGHCAYTLECERWRSGCGECPRLWALPAIPQDKTAQNWSIKREVYQRSSVHLVSPSKWIQRELESSIFSEAIATSRVIPNGVDHSVFRPADREVARNTLGLPHESLILVFSVANEANPYKDYATIKSALPAIVSAVAPREVVLLALGSCGPEQEFEGARWMPVPYTIDPRRVALHLQAADLGLHAANAENHPLAVIEAQSCGLPVVASAVGGIPETLVDGETGLLVAPRDPSAMALAASSLLNDDARRTAMGTAAAAHAARSFGLDRMVDDYVRTYREITGTVA